MSLQLRHIEKLGNQAKRSMEEIDANDELHNGFDGFHHPKTSIFFVEKCDFSEYTHTFAG